MLWLLHALGKNGSALPGLIIEKLNPKFLKAMLNGLPQGVLVITGTNGKTTTTKVISELFEMQGLKVLTNQTGSNFVRGIIATIIAKSPWSGRLPYDIAVFEQDEAHAIHFAELVQPKGVVGLNVMRDQMDRFGEIDNTASLIGKLAEQASDWVVFNNNDPRLGKIGSQLTNAPVSWFGHSQGLQADFLSDDQYHHADKLDFEQAVSDPQVLLTAYDGGGAVFNYQGREFSTKLLLDGSHNAINSAAAMATVLQVLPDTSFAKLVDDLSNIEPAFGRGERIILKNGSEVRLQLVKNPSGFTHSLRLLKLSDYDTAGLVINDDYADGRDVSWLWDVDFHNSLQAIPSIICGGTRGYDMAVRLKYDEIQSDVKIEPADFITQLIEPFSGKPGRIMLFCTYTAMLDLRRQLRQHSTTMAKVGL